MIRVATLKRKIENSFTKQNTAGYAPIELTREISKKSNAQISRMVSCYHDDLLPKLADNGIEMVDWSQLTQEEKQYIIKIFENRIFPILTPLAVDPSHPFPYISGLSLNLAVLLNKPETHEQLFARVKVPASLPRFMETAEFARLGLLPLNK